MSVIFNSDRNIHFRVGVYKLLVLLLNNVLVMALTGNNGGLKQIEKGSGVLLSCNREVRRERES